MTKEQIDDAKRTGIEVVAFPHKMGLRNEELHESIRAVGMLPVEDFAVGDGEIQLRLQDGRLIKTLRDE